MKMKFFLILFLFFLFGNLNCQKTMIGQKTGIIGLDLTAGHNSAYGAGGLSISVRPVNQFDLTFSVVTGRYEGFGYHTGIACYIKPYKLLFKDRVHDGLIYFNPFCSLGFCDLNSNSFIVSNNPGIETRYHSPGNKYLPISAGIKIELLGLDGSEIEDHSFISIMFTYRYCITNNNIQYTNGYFSQINLDNLNKKNLSPWGISVGGGFYFRSFLRKRELTL